MQVKELLHSKCGWKIYGLILAVKLYYVWNNAFVVDGCGKKKYLVDVVRRNI